MLQIFRALPWAFAMIFIAIASARGLIAKELALTLLAILPGVMVATFPRKRCIRARRGA